MAELEQLPATHQWALGTKLSGLAGFVKASAFLPMYAVGSGGSLTAAAFAAMLHRWTLHPARYVTPQMLAWEPPRRKCATLLLSAGGRNPEILDALGASGKPTGIVCTKTKNPLVESAPAGTYVHAAEPPTGRDGFLATNTLLATCVWLARAYGRYIDHLYEYDWPWTDLMEESFDVEARRTALGIAGTRHLLVLADACGWPAAVDAESKFHESGLAAVQVTDWRNFAHGRHHWLATNSGDTAILALVTPQSEDLAARTLDIIPEEIPVVRLAAPRRDAFGTLNLLVKVMHLVGWFGDARGVDPGRPKVAEFGRKIHHMNDDRV